MVYGKMDINVWEVMARPSGFMVLSRPRFGGAYIDPFYLSWKAHEVNTALFTLSWPAK